MYIHQFNSGEKKVENFTIINTFSVKVSKEKKTKPIVKLNFL